MALLETARRVHFIGVGGSGMSGLAELLALRGYRVTGSDLAAGATTERLANLGVEVHEGHHADHVAGAEVIVYSSAVRPDNPEMVEAARRHVPRIRRGELLAEVMRGTYGIAIAGAHGKTTTTSMVAVMLDAAGLDPTAIIGGRLSAFGSSVRSGRSRYVVAEADESDRSFLLLAPALAVITNIDYEHMESYRSFEELRQAFAAFANAGPSDGAVIACIDEGHLRSMLPLVTRRLMTYALDTASASISASDVRLEGFGARCEVWHRVPETATSGRTLAPRGHLGQLRLNVPGRHNLQNGLAAISVGLELGIGFETIASALETFRGAERRFQTRGEAGGVLVVDDYGHHPAEIAAVLAAARGTAAARVVVIFQPHRYTRTRDLLRPFAEALSSADEIILTDIYSAGEDALPGVTIEALAEEVRHVTSKAVGVVKKLAEVPSAVARLARPGDIVLTLGAGSIGETGDRILEELTRLRGGSGDATGT